MKKPLVSVIIPCYNYAKFLEQCVDSVVNQTYKNLEVIVINDGSTDNTDKVAKGLRDKYSIKYIKQQNQGIVTVRNKAVKVANGEYIIQLDADDYLDSNYIEKTLDTAVKTGADIVYTNHKTFGAEEQTSNFPDFNIEILKNSNFIHISALLKKESIKKYAFDEKLANKTHEDWDYFLNLCSHDLKAVLCKDTLLHYRIHPKSRNNRLNEDIERKSYMELYSYMISKYSKEFPNQYNYLIGKIFADWYLSLLQNTENIRRMNADYIETLQRKENEINDLKSSRIWKVRNLLAKIIGKEVI